MSDKKHTEKSAAYFIRNAESVKFKGGEIYSEGYGIRTEDVGSLEVDGTGVYVIDPNESKQPVPNEPTKNAIRWLAGHVWHIVSGLAILVVGTWLLRMLGWM